MGEKTLLVSETIRLRPVEVEKDVDIALPWYQDMEVLKGTAAVGRETPYDRETVESMFRHLEGTGECFIIEIREDEDWIPVGDVTLSEKDIPIVIGRREYWGRGIAGRVLEFLAQRAREKGFKKIGPLEIYRSNMHSLNLFRSAGFREISADDTSVFFEMDFNGP